MKKTMRIATIILALVLATSCFVGGTFAKYIASATGEDKARVAYWGFQDEGNIEITELFVDVYDGNGDLSVDSINDEDVIAPGTTNSATFEFVYVNNDAEGAEAPEVAYTLSIDTTGSEIAADIDSNANIQWKLDDGEWGRWADLLAAIDALDGGAGVQTYAPNELPAAFADGTTHTVSWQWIFTGADPQDDTDTAMGNKATLDEVKLVINVAATQIDTLAE